MVTARAHSGQQIPLTPPGRAPVIFLFVVLVPFLAFLVWLYIGSTDGLASDKARAQWPGLLLTAFVGVVSLAPILWAIRRRELVLTDTSLVFRGGFYSRTVPLSHLRTAAALEVSLLSRTEFTPRWRTNAIGLPGYRVGWFRLRNSDKALLYLTDPFRVTYLPTTDGFVFLLSTGALLDALQQRDPSSAAQAAPPATGSAP